jgi:hypothetical protein
VARLVPDSPHDVAKGRDIASTRLRQRPGYTIGEHVRESGWICDLRLRGRNNAFVPEMETVPMDREARLREL